MNIKIIDKYIFDNNIDELERYFKVSSIDEQKCIIDYLISQLIEYKMPEDINKRNMVAITLSELKCEEAVPWIVKVITNEYESKYIGTLVYSLQNLNCVEYIEQLFHLLYSGNYEVRRSVFDLLEQNKNKLSPKALERMRKNLIETIEIYKDILLGLFITKDEIFDI